MNVYNRRLFFNRGGQVSARGTGITSGLVPRYGHGGPVSEHTNMDTIKSDADEYYELLKGATPERKPFSRLAAASPALLELGGKLLSAKSLQGGVSGGLDILGQAASASAPGFAQAIQARREYEAADPETDLRAKALSLAITKDANRAKQKPGETKAVWYKNPNFNPDEAESADNLKHIESTRRLGTDGILRIKDITKGSSTFGMYVSEDNFPSFMVSDPVKVQARKSGDVWVVNPAYEGKDPINMYINSKFKTDEFGNTFILDKIPGSSTFNDYVPEDQFKEFRFTEPKEAMESEGEKIKITKINTMIQDEFDRINKKQGKTDRVLSDAELNTIRQRAGTDDGDWNKFSQQYAKTFNELSAILKDYQDVDTLLPKISIEFDDQKEEKTEEEKTEEETSNVNKKVYNIETQRDHIDERFNLDKTDDNYDIQRERAMREYRLIDPIPQPVQDSMNSAFTGFKDLKMMTDNIREGSYILGNIKRITSAFGLDPGATEFITGEKGTLVSATAALIKGIPSDFDVKNLKDTIPSIGQGDSVNIVRARRLQRMYNDIIKNSLAWHAGQGYRIPEAVEIKARALIGNQAVNEALNTNRYTTQKLADIQTMSTEEFIKEYGDPFQESLNLLDIPDSELLPTLNEAEAEELRLYEEKMFGKTK
jgi:hypothetical protein